MNMGTIATIAREKPLNLIVIVWDNEEWGQTGHQPSHTATGTNLELVAKACGITNTATVSTNENLESVFKTALESEGPWFIVAKIQESDYQPFAPIEPELTVHRCRESFIGSPVASHRTKKN
jgi:thiamine pyrophosphate-dependent acetolactate synthase large subunit-like protein